MYTAISKLPYQTPTQKAILYAIYQDIRAYIAVSPTRGFLINVKYQRRFEAFQNMTHFDWTVFGLTTLLKSSQRQTWAREVSTLLLLGLVDYAGSRHYRTCS
jgi:hypothetical protein